MFFWGGGLLFSLSYHAFDTVFYPWLPKIVSVSSIETLAAPWAHPLFDLVHPSPQKRQLEHGVNMDARTWFFPDYLPPDINCLKWLRGISFLVSSRFAAIYDCEMSEPAMMEKVLPSRYRIQDFASLRYGRKIGLVIKGQGDLVGAFFKWTRNPTGSDETKQLVDEICKAGKFDDVVIAGIDFEAAWIGSAGGARTWKAFFELIRQNDLEKYFISLRDAESRIQNTVHLLSGSIHAATGDKWTKYPEQVRYVADLMNFVPQTDGQHLLLAIAAGSDVLSRMHALMESSRGTIPAFDVRDFDGRVTRVDLSRGNDDIIPVGHAASRALLCDRPFRGWLAQRMKKQKRPSFFLRRLSAFAEQNGL